MSRSKKVRLYRKLGETWFEVATFECLSDAISMGTIFQHCLNRGEFRVETGTKTYACDDENTLHTLKVGMCDQWDELRRMAG